MKIIIETFHFRTNVVRKDMTNKPRNRLKLIIGKRKKM